MRAITRSLAFTLLALAACAESPSAVAADAPPVAPSELAAALAADDAPLLLDVRTPEEFAAGHVPGATLVPVQELEARASDLAAYRERGVITY
jgi:rhodanese-related sulfurtransferase